MTDIPSFPYALLWGERVLRSVANLTRADARAFFAWLREHPVRVETHVLPLSQANEALEVIDSNLEGKPHSMKSLSSKLGIPYTSVSRIVYSLTAEAQPGGVLKLVPDNKDRRRKHIELDTDALKRMGSHVRALEKAMIDYYGSSVYKLKKDQPN